MLYMLIGLLAGITSGIGLGGGIILIPALTFIYTLPQQQAQSINLLYFIPTALIAVYMHLKQGNIEKSIIPKMVMYGIIASIIGALIAVRSDPSHLKVMFGYFMLIMGIYEFFKVPKHQ